MLCVNPEKIPCSSVFTYLWLPVPPNDMREALTPPFPLSQVTLNRKCHPNVKSQRIYCDFGLLIQNLRAICTCNNSYLQTLGTLVIEEMNLCVKQPLLNFNKK